MSLFWQSVIFDESGDDLRKGGVCIEVFSEFLLLIENLYRDGFDEIAEEVGVW